MIEACRGPKGIVLWFVNPPLTLEKLHAYMQIKTWLQTYIKCNDIT